MKKIIALYLIMQVFYSCKNNQTDQGAPAPDTIKTEFDSMALGKKFGDTTITPEGSILASEIYKTMDNHDSMDIKLKGKIVAVCQTAGCWLKLEADSGKTVMVRTGEEFFFDKDCVGKMAVVQGRAEWEITSEGDRKHLAKDDGKSEKEIAQIKGDEKNLIVWITGAIVK